MFTKVTVVGIVH